MDRLNFGQCRPTIIIMVNIASSESSPVQPGLGRLGARSSDILVRPAALADRSQLAHLRLQHFCRLGFRQVALEIRISEPGQLLQCHLVLQVLSFAYLRAPSREASNMATGVICHCSSRKQRLWSDRCRSEQRRKTWLIDEKAEDI
jgi:hypothetical protein